MPSGDRAASFDRSRPGTVPAGGLNGRADGFRVSGGPGPRRHAGRVAGGVVLVVACAVLVVALVSGAGHRRAVLAVVRPVAAGEPITAGDLRTVNVSAAAGVSLIPAGERAAVLGRPAAVALAAGGLLTDGQVGGASVPAAGRALVGVVVKPGQYPPGLAAGDHVTVIDAATAPTTATPATAPPADATLAVGVVTGVEPAGISGTGEVVTVDVPGTAAQPVAIASSNGQAGLVQTPATAG